MALHTGTALDVLRGMPEKSVHMCVTSPPYFGLRSYLAEEHFAKGQEIGTEKTPDEFVAKLVEVFAEVWRVLRDDGNVLGQHRGFLRGFVGQPGPQGLEGEQRQINGPMLQNFVGYAETESKTGSWVNGHPTLKPKDLCMIPARLALALQSWGWYLRSEITWIKPNPMPESVTDRPTSSTEKVYLLSKKPRYFYDAEAVKETSSRCASCAGVKLTNWTLPETTMTGCKGVGLSPRVATCVTPGR